MILTIIVVKILKFNSMQIRFKTRNFKLKNSLMIFKFNFKKVRVKIKFYKMKQK